MYTLYMALHITNPETERNVRRLAEITGEPIAKAVNQAAIERIKLVSKKQDDPTLMADIDAILAEFRKLPILDNRSADELIGYDEYGLPT